MASVYGVQFDENHLLIIFFVNRVWIFKSIPKQLGVLPEFLAKLNMCPRELLELGDRIGHVSTGLREDEIFRCLRKTKQPLFGASPFCFSEMEKKCSIRQGKVPLLSLEAIHQLHIFIFVLAVTHVVLSALTMLLAGAKIRQWRHWEDTIQRGNERKAPKKVTQVRQVEFIKDRFQGFGKDSMILSWLHSFIKQFFGSVTQSDYTTMRLGFIMTHCRGNPKFHFYKYMVRALEADFKKVVGISWYLWIFVVVFLLLNVHGWHVYFWMSFIPLILLLLVGTKLEHIITQLAHEIAEKHTAVEGDLVVKPSNYHFWFHRPRIILYLIHFILFQNAFELSFFFWILTTYSFNSCIMGQVGFIVPRLVISVIIQLLCSYSTLPLYAIVTQMGSSFKKVIFNDHVQEGLAGWAQKVKNRKGRKVSDEEIESNTMKFQNQSYEGINLQNIEVQKVP